MPQSSPFIVVDKELCANPNSIKKQNVADSLIKNAVDNEDTDFLSKTGQDISNLDNSGGEDFEIENFNETDQSAKIFIAIENY